MHGNPKKITLMLITQTSAQHHDAPLCGSINPPILVFIEEIYENIRAISGYSGKTKLIYRETKHSLHACDASTN